MNVIATYPDGSTREMPEQHAKILAHLGKATYRTQDIQRPAYITRDLVAAPAMPSVPEPAIAEVDADEAIDQAEDTQGAVEDESSEQTSEQEAPRRRGRPRKAQAEE